MYVIIHTHLVHNEHIKKRKYKALHLSDCERCCVCVQERIHGLYTCHRFPRRFSIKHVEILDQIVKKKRSRTAHFCAIRKQ